MAKVSHDVAKASHDAIAAIMALWILVAVQVLSPASSFLLRSYHRDTNIYDNNIISDFISRNNQLIGRQHSRSQHPIFYEEEIDSNIRFSQWAGAGSPRVDLLPEEIPILLMGALRMNDLPSQNAGLRSVWEFAGDTTRHIFQHNITEFIESAHETAETMPTSFYGVAMRGREWTMETRMNHVGGEDGWIATQVMKSISSDGRVRRWQWELRRNRRPPNLGAWYVESIGSSDRKGNFEAE